MPSKLRAKAWKRIRSKLQEETLAFAELKRVRRVRQIHRIEKSIEELEAKGSSKEQVEKVQSLRKRLDEM